MTCPSPARLADLRDPALPADERAAITEHAESCEDCRAAIVALFASSVPPPTGPAPELAVGTTIGRYVVEGRLGAGAMGIVYTARDPELDRRVAIKLLRDRGGDSTRLLREAQALARIAHPNVVAVHDVGQHGDQIFVALELVRGQTLRQWLKSAPAASAIVDKLVEVARGLAAAHAAGLVHRDVKPDNILVGDDGRARITDFGLARASGDLIDKPSEGSPLLDDMTRTGAIVGTPLYAAPEQLAGEQVDELADQFSFCVTSYEALYGVRPFAGADVPALVAAIRKGIEPPAKRGIPAAVRGALARGLAVDPKARHASMQRLAAELEPRARRWPLLVTGGAMLAVAGGLVIGLRSSSETSREPASRCDSASVLAGVYSIGDNVTGGGAHRGVAILDRYAAAWIEARDVVCRAEERGQPASELAPRISCLDAALVQLGAVSRAKTTSAAVLEQELIPIAACASAAGDAPVGPDAAIAKRVSELRAKIADARIAISVGNVSDAGSRVTDLLARAGELKYAPLEAEANAVAGTVAGARGDQAGAITHLRRAITLAEASKHDQLKALAAIALARAFVRTGRFEEAAHELDLAAAAASRIGGDARLTLDIAMVRARIADATGHTDEAIAQYQKAIAEASKLPELRFTTATYQLELQSVFVRIGRNAEAAELFAQASRVLQEHYGTDDRAKARQLADACEKAQLAGDLARALPLCSQVAIDVEVAHGPDAVELANARLVLGVTHDLLHEWASARDHHARAAAIFEKANQVVDAAFELENVGRDSIELGDHTRAIQALEHSIALAKRDPSGAPQVEFSRAALGRALAAAGDHARAIGELEWAIRKFEAKTPPARNVLATSRLALADALWQRASTGDRERAKATAKLAREDALAFRATFPDEAGLNTYYRRRMDRVIGQIDAWTAKH